MPPCVLVAAADPDVLALMALSLRRLGLRALCAGSGEESVEPCARPGGVDLALLDLDMPGLGGRGALAALRGAAPSLPVILVTGLAELLGASELSRLRGGAGAGEPPALIE